MRVFRDEHGYRWRVWVDGAAAPRGAENGVGWAALIFEADDTRSQRTLYRPVGWLSEASEEALQAALEESESVRASWGS